MDDLLSKLVKETGIMPIYLQAIANTAPKRYKDFYIEKRGKGKRLISQPSAELKIVQRALIRVLLDKLPIHDAAMAYREGRSILGNALPHAGHHPILKMDFKNFFPSITSIDWRAYCLSRAILNETDIQLSSLLLFRQQHGNSLLRLAIGAPSSPILSNILMYDFDVAITNLINKDKVVYTRYADDLTFSAKRTGYLNSVHGHIRTAIRGISLPRLTINKDKTTLITTKYGRRVTGLTLTNDGRVTVGHARKREVRSAVHRAKQGTLNIDQLETLSGHLAFINAVEPGYLGRLKDVYGVEVVVNILRIQKRKKYKPN